MKVTVVEFAGMHGIHVSEAAGALKVLAKTGHASVEKIVSGKPGKPAFRYNIDGRVFGRTA